MLEAPRDQWPPSALRPCGIPFATWPIIGSRVRSTNPDGSTSPGSSSGPGRGFPLDEVRIKALWPYFHQGVRYTKEVQCWAEWWILWRRVASGLSRPHHEEIYRRLAPFLVPVKGSSPSKKAGRSKPEPHEVAEMWRCAASLERLTPEAKESLGNGLLKETRQASLPGYVLWSMGRLGARVPLYGPANTVIRKETSEHWITVLLGRAFSPGRETGDAIFALCQLARVANDRARDIDETLRSKVLDRLSVPWGRRDGLASRAGVSRAGIGAAGPGTWGRAADRPAITQRCRRRNNFCLIALVGLLSCLSNARERVPVTSCRCSAGWRSRLPDSRK